MFLKQKKNNVFIIPNFVKTDLFIQKKESNQEIKRIIFVGHVSRNKGINELLECASALPNITFDIIGPLSKEFDKNHSLKNVVFHGNQPFQEIVKFLNRADIFVLPSYSEGFSIAIIEAMAAGLPLIVSKVGANEDIVKTESGILMESISSSEIINGVYELSDISKRNNISKHNYTTAKEKYDIDVVLNQLFNLYGEIE
jgi:glycosyltransferase involved in cell wall biosynthesis